MTDIDTDALEWGYSGPGGPEHWASLAPEYAPCDEGVQQSPIDIAGYEDGDAPGLSLSYDGDVSGVALVRGSIVVSFGPDSSLVLAERRYELQSAHAHAPAEHRVDGEEFAAELHVLHQDASGELAVVGVLYRSATRVQSCRRCSMQSPREERRRESSRSALPTSPRAPLVSMPIRARKRLPRALSRWSGSSYGMPERSRRNRWTRSWR